MLGGIGCPQQASLVIAVRAGLLRYGSYRQVIANGQINLCAGEVGACVPRQGAERSTIANVHLWAKTANNASVNNALLFLPEEMPQPVLLAGDINGCVSRRMSMGKVKEYFAQRGGSIEGLHAATDPDAVELREPCAMGIFRAKERRSGHLGNRRDIR